MCLARTLRGHSHALLLTGLGRLICSSQPSLLMFITVVVKQLMEVTTPTAMLALVYHTHVIKACGNRGDEAAKRPHVYPYIRLAMHHAYCPSTSSWTEQGISCLLRRVRLDASRGRQGKI